jgi:hypothetical protein
MDPRPKDRRYPIPGRLNLLLTSVQMLAALAILSAASNTKNFYFISLPALSPDDTIVAIPRPNETGGSDLWLYNLVRGTRSRFTFNEG